MLLDLRFLRLGLGFPLLFCGLRHGIWSFRLRAYLVLILPGSGNLAPEKTTRLLAAVSHKQLFGSFRGPRVEKPKKTAKQSCSFRANNNKVPNLLNSLNREQTSERALRCNQQCT